jgi:acyl-CoA synthetase (AMP-forming)/AMP-acid ligase II
MLSGASRSGALTMGDLLAVQVRRAPQAIAIVEGSRERSYLEFNRSVNQLTYVLAARGVGRGARIAVLSENRIAYLEAAFAAAKLGAILCALNWRLVSQELAHCIQLVDPAVALVSARFRDALRDAGWGGSTVDLDDGYEALLAGADDAEPPVIAQPEDGLLILYTSGTTGLPKAAVISHRAELARLTVSRVDLDLREEDGFIAWAPMFHMVSLEHAMHVLCVGGKVFVVPGPEQGALIDIVERERLWWLPLMPGMLDGFLQEMHRRRARPKGVKLVGGLADLLPPQTIAETSALLDARFWNTFGSTETGMLPVAGTTFPPGEIPADVAKAHNSLYAWRLVDTADRDVAVGEPGEIVIRGPTVFSGYWNADEANASAFRGGWYHMGDMFIELPDGRLNYVDRTKYLIKSGGENIYPVEIERVLMADPGVVEAVVVKRRDAVWGETPVAFVVVRDESVTSDHLLQVCRRDLSSYKCPREIHILSSQDEFPRSTTGKVQRQVLEQWL